MWNFDEGGGGSGGSHQVNPSKQHTFHTDSTGSNLKLSTATEPKALFLTVGPL